jgi:hypothetical protein
MSSFAPLRGKFQLREADTSKVDAAIQSRTRGETSPDRIIRSWSIRIVALLMLGAIEMSWIAIYRLLPAGDATIVARGVSEALMPDTLSATAAVPFGIAIELGLAMMAGVAVSCLARVPLPRNAPKALEAAVVSGSIAGLWAVNFLLVLFEINPELAGLFDSPTNIIYNVLIGCAAALIFRYHDGYRLKSDRDRIGTTVPFEYD